MALADIQARVEGIVLDVTTEAQARVVPEIQQAQRELEDAHGFLSMEATLELTTVEGRRGGFDGLTTHYNKPQRFVRSRMDARPVLVDGTGATTEIDWLIAESDIARLYSDNPIDKGAPRHVLERIVHFAIFPYPDALAPGGTLFSDGNWRVRIPYFQRETTLSVGGTTSNWFTVNAEEYLTQQAAGKVLAFNRDHEESLLALQRAQSEKLRLIHHDKRARVSKQRLLRPKSGARGSAYQVRGSR